MNDANIIKIIRLKKGITQRQLAELVGVSESAISKCEKSSPQMTTIHKVAKAVGMELEEVLKLEKEWLR